MPITINGSGTLTGISAGGLPDDCITTADIAAGAVTAPKLGTTEQSQLCKAWVNFNGTGAVAIRASYNVSSITDLGTGTYKLNFTSSLPDGNYAAAFGGSDGAWGNAHLYQNQLAGSIELLTLDNNGTNLRDLTFIYTAIFR